MKHTVWDDATYEQLQDFARQDQCLDMMVPSDLRMMLQRAKDIGDQEHDDDTPFWGGVVLGAGSMLVFVSVVYFIVEWFL